MSGSEELTESDHISSSPTLNPSYALAGVLLGQVTLTEHGMEFIQGLWTEVLCPQCPVYTPTFLPEWNQSPTRYKHGWVAPGCKKSKPKGSDHTAQVRKEQQHSLVQVERPEGEREDGFSHLESEPWKSLECGISPGAALNFGEPSVI